MISRKLEPWETGSHAGLVWYTKAKGVEREGRVAREEGDE